jgi:hypothetical protein
MFLFSQKTRSDADICTRSDADTCTTEPGKNPVDPETEEAISSALWCGSSQFYVRDSVKFLCNFRGLTPSLV